MGFQNQHTEIYFEQGGASLICGTGGVITNNGSINNTGNGGLKESVTAFTTASTGSITQFNNAITVTSSGGTAKSLSLSGAAVGDKLTIHWLTATATGFVSVNVGGTARTFDGANYIYKGLKSGEFVKIQLATTGRWIELARSVADGTALGSTST